MKRIDTQRLETARSQEDPQKSPLDGSVNKLCEIIKVAGSVSQSILVRVIRCKYYLVQFSIMTQHIDAVSIFSLPSKPSRLFHQWHMIGISQSLTLCLPLTLCRLNMSDRRQINFLADRRCMNPRPQTCMSQNQ